MDFETCGFGEIGALRLTVAFLLQKSDNILEFGQFGAVAFILGRLDLAQLNEFAVLKISR